MIVRLWRGAAASPEKAHAYFEHVTGRVFPSLKSLPGHVDAWLLRREVDGKTRVSGNDVVGLARRHQSIRRR